MTSQKFTVLMPALLLTVSLVGGDRTSTKVDQLAKDGHSQDLGLPWFLVLTALQPL